MRHLGGLMIMGLVASLIGCQETGADDQRVEQGFDDEEGSRDLGSLNLTGEEGTGRRRDAAIRRARGHMTQRRDRIAFDRDHTFDVSDVILDSDGKEHVRFDRRYRGLRVIGGDLVIHSASAGDFEDVDQAFKKQIVLNGNPAVRPDSAERAALRVFKGGRSRTRRPELIVYARDNTARLAYEVVFEGTVKDEDPTELHVIIDARTGATIDQWDGIQTIAGTGRAFFTGTVPLETTIASGRYQLRDPLRGNQQTNNLANRTSGSGTLLLDTDNIWGNFTLSDTATVGVDAQYGASVTWDYLANKFQRRGLRNTGIGALSRVHYGRKYNNAFWSDSCFCMTYGDGDGTTFNPFATLDVAGHEMIHGLTSVTAKLVYSGESGGLNEATSDILGTLVEFYANNSIDKPDYTIGERLYRSGGGKALRYMHKPSLDGRSPDCYSPTIGSLDVHYSSGVANHFFYILAEGTNPNNGFPVSPSCNSSTVGGIGRDAAGAIWYRALTVYMTSNTNYAAARQATLNAARDLYTEASAQYQAVALAWSAVGVN